MQEFIEGQTTNGHTYKLLGFITARQKRELAALVMGIKKHGDDKQYDYNDLVKHDDAVLAMLVTELDGDKEKIVDRMLDLPSVDFDEKKAATGKILEPEEKKTE
jgi:hypothetical protein